MRKTLLAGLLALIGSGVAQAAPLTQTFTAGIDPTLTPFTQSTSLSLFDSNLGTLTGVTFDIQGWAQTDASIQATTVTEGFIAANAHFLLFSEHSAFADVLASSGNETQAFLNPSFSAPLTSFSISLDAGESVSFDADGSAAFSLDSGSFNQLLGLQQAGGGLFNIGCTSIGVITTTLISGNVSTDQSTEASCLFSVTYHYESAPPTNQVPEPGTIALLGLGLSLAGLGSGLARRRTKP